MFLVETYTNAEGSNLDMIPYQVIDIDEIANDLVNTINDWDYAIVWDDETGDIYAIVINSEDGYEINIENK